MARGNHFAKGGSRKAPEMKSFYKKLDEACLDSIDYLRAVVLKAKKVGLDSGEWRRDGINAAGKLIQKAPERVGDPDGNPIKSPVIYLPGQHDDRDDDNGLETA